MPPLPTCFRHSDFCWKARSRFVLAIALELLIAFVEVRAARKNLAYCPRLSWRATDRE
jgi:hypothetical protein